MRLVFVLVASLVLAWGAACASTPASSPAMNVLRPRDFVPLAVGNRWEYRVTTAASSEPTTEEVRIIEKDAEGFYLDNQGGRLAPRTDGVFDGTRFRFMIEGPIEEGHEWIAVPKDEPNVVERYKIVSVGTTASVPAGVFEGCIEVEASQEVRLPPRGERGVGTMTWTYAPGVGLVKAVQTVTPPARGPMTMMTLELVRYDVAPQG